MLRFFYLTIVSAVVGIIVVLCDNLENLNIERDAKLSPPELIEAYGYPSELHNIVTEDGYILEVHRIANPGKQPVILMHGLLDSSATWVMIGPKHSLGYILYDQNYDIWLLNARGNDYSTGHIKYHRNGTNREQKKYWNFSWHEIGKYDLAASIDYILKNTSYPKVHYCGHSQGTTSYFVLTSERPEYNDKILLMVAMAPPVFMNHLENELLQMNVRYLPSIETVSDWIGFYEFSKETNYMIMQAQKSIFCTLDIVRNTQLCNHNFSPLVGNMSNHIDPSILPIVDGHAPAGASTKQLFHYGQLVRSHRFCQFDYGAEANLHIYNRTTPPDYKLENCLAPVAIIYADQDNLAAAEDVRHLPEKLPNVVQMHRVDNDTFNHIDFIWATDAKELVYDYVLDWMKTEEQRQQKQRQRQNNNNLRFWK